MQHRLDKKKLRLIAFTDSSFANNDDCSTQLGYVLVLTDDTNRANILHYSSYKSKRIVRSVLGGETYAFADGFDAAFMVRYDVERMVGARVPLTMLTDSESLFKVIVKCSVTTEKRLMVDIRAAREAYERGDISNVGWIRSPDNIADGLTKIAKCGALVQLMRTGVLTTTVEQWVIRRGIDEDRLGDDTQRGGRRTGTERMRLSRLSNESKTRVCERYV